MAAADTTIHAVTLITPLCQVYEKEDGLPKEVWDRVLAAIQRVEKDTGKNFGAQENPLLFSCRSGAAISMPGKYWSA